MSNPSSSPPSSASSAKPSRQMEPRPVWLRFAHRVRRPLESFLRIEAASGILLLVAAGVALAWANSRWAQSYIRLWHTPVGIHLGGLTFERSLEWFINDTLMVVFFFVVGMEIRRELSSGDLSSWRKAALPAFAAVGGMIAPAALYVLLAGGPTTRAGWGVPMATDIAFAVGILTLLGARVPPALRVLLLALAIIDDLGAILVIAIFYSSGIALFGIVLALFGVSMLLAMQRGRVRAKLAYLIPAMIIWVGVYRAGVHPSIAGVLIGLLTPVTAWLAPERLLTSANPRRGALDAVSPSAPSPHATETRGTSPRHFDAIHIESLAPADSLIKSLHPWVAFGILPVFALANAGVTFSAAAMQAPAFTVAFAVSVGLVLGKPIGILLASLIAVRLRLASLPIGISTRHLLVLGVTSGIGFTMALFVSQLAFVDERLLAAAKCGTLVASAIAAFCSVLLGLLLLPLSKVTNAADADAAAEHSTEA